MKFTVVVLVAALFAAAAQGLVVGVFTDPMEECPRLPPSPIPSTECVPSYIPRWLEASGARIVVVPWNASTAYHIDLASKVNGLVFPGGGLWSDVRVEYFNKVRALVRGLYGLDGLAPQGSAPVIVGICYGFEMLMASLADDWGLIEQGYKGMDPLPALLSLNFTDAQPNSRIFGTGGRGLSDGLVNDLATKPTTLNWHKAGVPPSAWSNAKFLQKGLRLATPLSTNAAPIGGKLFVSSVESVSSQSAAAPRKPLTGVRSALSKVGSVAAAVPEFYGLQFHPTRAMYEFTHEEIGHTPVDIELGQATSRFFATRMRLNKNSFASKEDVEALRLEQHPLVDFGWGLRTYWIPTNVTEKLTV